MASRIVVRNGVYDLSEINNLKDLKEEIAFLKASIDKDEDELQERFHTMPKHILKATADNVLPAFLNRLIANGTWKLLLSGAAMFANPFSRGMSFKKNIVGAAKKLGFLTLVKTGYKMLSKNREEKGSQKISPKKSEVTMLKTKNVRKG